MFALQNYNSITSQNQNLKYALIFYLKLYLSATCYLFHRYVGIKFKFTFK